MTAPRTAARWVAAVALIVLATACGQKLPPESAALVDVIRGAQTAELNLDTAPDIQVELAKYYTGPLLSRKAIQYQTAIRAKADAGGGDRIGGVKTLDLKSVQVSGATAKVVAEVTVWFKTAQFRYQSASSQPTETNIIDLELHIDKDGGVWKIDQEHSQFAPGGGP